MVSFINMDDKNVLSRSLSPEQLARALSKDNESKEVRNLNDSLDASFSNRFNAPVGNEVSHVMAYEIFPIQSDDDPAGYVGVPLFVSFRNYQGTRFLAVLLSFEDSKIASSKWLIEQISTDSLLSYLKADIDKYRLLSTAISKWIAFPDSSPRLIDISEPDFEQLATIKKWRNVFYQRNMTLVDGSDSAPNEANEETFIDLAEKGLV